MKLIDIAQNTEIWLEQRKKYVGGSDVASIMSVSKWRTVLQLYEEKKGICTPDQASKAYIFWKGHHFEDIARAQYEKTIGFDIPPQVVRSHLRHYMQVSLDCYNPLKNFVGEIKFQGKADWILLKEQGVVPDCYYPQLQYQLACTGLDEIHFIGINQQKRIASTIVKPDKEYIVKMLRWCDHFSDLVQRSVPPKVSQQDYKFLNRKLAKTECDQIFDIDQRITDLLKERTTLQESVLKQAKSTRMVYDRKLLINVSHFDDKRDLSLIKELNDMNVQHLGKAISNDLKLIIIENLNTDIKGASRDCRESRKEQQEQQE